MQNVQIGIVWGAEESLKVIGNVTFDRVHTTSYSTLIENVHLSGTVFEI